MKKEIKNLKLKLTALVSALVLTTSMLFIKPNDNKTKTPKFEVITITNNKLPEDFKTKIKSDNYVIVVEPTGCRYADIYKTIDFVKKTLENYEINAPILYDVENNELSNDNIFTRANVLLAEEFCNKLIANGVYAGLYGSDNAMTEFDKNFYEHTKSTTDLYDKLILVDTETVEYNGVYSMTINEKGKYTSEYELSEVIKDNKLNEPDFFIEDEIYVVKKGDILSTIASKYGMKTEDLAKYNDISKNNIYVGDKIKIPNTYGKNIVLKDNKEEKTSNKTENETFPSETNSRILKGIDVNQIHEHVDWKKAKEEGKVEFVIIKLNDFSNDDGDYVLEYPKDKKQKYPEINPFFIDQVQGCIENDIPFGIYYYSRATTVEDGKKEAKAVIRALEEYIPGAELKYPIYMDVECEKQQQMCKNGTFNSIAEAAMKVFESNKYFSGIYCNITQVTNETSQSRNNFINGANTIVNGDNFIADMYNKYTLWLVNNQNYNSKTSVPKFNPIMVSSMLRTGVPMAQYTEHGSCPGIEGPVDVDYALEQLTETVQKSGLNKVKKRN